MFGSKRLGWWWLVHKWTSLVCTAFLFVLCLTGLPLIFSDEIQAWLAPEAAPAVAAQAGPLLPLAEIASELRHQQAQDVLLFLFWDEAEPQRVGAGVADRLDAPLEDVRRLLVDEHTGRVVAERSNSKFLAVLLELHRNLYLGAAGDLVLGFVGLCLLASVVSGVVLYGPFMRRIAFGTIRHTSLRLECLDLHNLLGVITLGWVLVVSGTGFVNTLEAPLFGAWQARELPRLLAADAGRAAPLELASLDAVLAAARGALPEMEPTSIGLPGSRFGSEHHFLVWMRGTSRLTSRLFTPVLVDAESGRVSDARGLPWYLRALELARPLHFGDYGGVPLKVLWGLLDLLLLSLLITGAYLWLARASQARSQRARPT